MAPPKSKARAAPAGGAVAPGDHVYLIDGSGYIFRAYHALPPLTRPSDGLPVGAVHGFCGMLWKLLRETGEPSRPRISRSSSTYPSMTFRNDLFDGLQGQPPRAARRPHPAIPADPRRGATPSTSPASSRSGYEADDLIATYARAGASRPAPR